MSDSSAPIVLTRDQVRRVDRIAIERFHVPGIVLMENASRGTAEAILSSNLPHKQVLILCGGGNNGGDGLAVVRHLHNAGSAVTIGLCTDPAKYTGDALINWRIVQAMNLPTFAATPEALAERLGGDNGQAASRPDLVVDAIFGTGLSAAPRDPFPAVAETLNRTGVPVVAIDLPSGLDCDTGRPLGQHAIRAKLTVTFVARKAGFDQPGAAQYTGTVRVADIGCPAEAVGLAVGE